MTTPSKRKSKKNAESSSTVQNNQASASSKTVQNQATDHDSFGTSVKFIVGVALVSVIIGIVLGKRY